MGGNKIAPNPALVDTYPDVYLSTGLVAENHARESAISREEQDAFALAQPSARGRGDRRRPLQGRDRAGHRAADVAGDGDGPARALELRHDEGPRRDTSLEALAKLRPAFHVTGTVTAGNSSQTSDGAAAVVVMSADCAQASTA